MPIAVVTERASRDTRATVRRARLGALSAFVLIAAAACAAIDAQTNSFATLAEARQAGAIANGWIPDGLPPGSHDIREGHVPGTPSDGASLTFRNRKTHRSGHCCSRKRSSTDGQRCEVPGRVEWWPIILRGTLDSERIAATQLRAYRAKNGNLMFAVNWNQGRADPPDAAVSLSCLTIGDARAGRVPMRRTGGDGGPCAGTPIGATRHVTSSRRPGCAGQSKSVPSAVISSMRVSTTARSAAKSTGGVPPPF